MIVVASDLSFLSEAARQGCDLRRCFSMEAIKKCHPQKKAQGGLLGDRGGSCALLEPGTWSLGRERIVNCGPFA